MIYIQCIFHIISKRQFFCLLAFIPLFYVNASNNENWNFLSCCPAYFLFSFFFNPTFFFLSIYEKDVDILSLRNVSIYDFDYFLFFRLKKIFHMIDYFLVAKWKLGASKYFIFITKNTVLIVVSNGIFPKFFLKSGCLIQNL